MTLLKKTGQVEKLLCAVKTATRLHPESEPVWSERLKTSINLGVSNKKILREVEKCLSTVPEKVRALLTF